MRKIANTQPEPSQPSKILRGIKSACTIWIRATENFSHTHGQVSGSKNVNPINVNKKVNNQQCFNEK